MSVDPITALGYMAQGYDEHFNAGTPLMALHVAEIAERVAGLEAELAKMAVNVREVIAFIQPGGYSERLAERVLTDPEVHAFAFVADREYKRAEKAEAEVLRLQQEAANTSATLAYYRERAERADATLSRMQVRHRTYSGPRNGSEYE